MQRENLIPMGVGEYETIIMMDMVVGGRKRMVRNMISVLREYRAE